MKFAFSNVLNCFAATVIGTKVVAKEAFMTALNAAMANFEIPDNGQCFVPLTCLDTVVSGVAKRENLSEGDIITREWRGGEEEFAVRSKAEPAESLAAIVYTREAYVNDPQVDEAEIEQIGDADYVLVAVLASVGPRPEVSVRRFEANLAGGNNAYSEMSAEEVEDLRKRVYEYNEVWITVAD